MRYMQRAKQRLAIVIPITLLLIILIILSQHPLGSEDGVVLLARSIFAGQGVLAPLSRRIQPQCCRLDWHYHCGLDPELLRAASFSL